MERLNVLAEGYASAYADRSGIAADEVRELMRSETWMGSTDAVSRGFADSVADDSTGSDDQAQMVARAEAARSKSIQFLAHRAEQILHSQEPRKGDQSIAPSGPEKAREAAKEGIMPKKTATTQNGGQSINPEDTTGKPPNAQTPAPAGDPAPQNTPVQMTNEQAVAAERQRGRDIMNAARPHIDSGAITQEFVDQLVDQGVTADAASSRILAELSGTQPDIHMTRPAGATRVGREDVETRRAGLEEALTARMMGEDPEDDRARPYADMSIHEMAAVSMGQQRPGYGSFSSRANIIQMAMHSSSDFPNILEGSLNRVLASNYELVERTFTEISREMEFNDFRAHDVVRPDEFPTLQKIGENGEIKFGTLGDSKESVILGAYATGISISRQALVNDDLGAIQDVIDNAAMIVPEFEEDVFWTMFAANAALSDGTAMFHADHGNLAAAGDAISVTAVSAGRKALRGMKAADKKRVIKQNAPSILLVGPARETAAEQFVGQVIQPTKTSDTNPFTGKLKVVVTETITNNAWYLLVDPRRKTHNFRHGYLRDARAPRIRVENPFGVQGMQMTLEADFGAGGVNYRGAYKNPGQ